MKCEKNLKTTISFKNAKVEYDGEKIVVIEDTKDGVERTELLEILMAYFDDMRYDITITNKITE